MAGIGTGRAAWSLLFALVAFAALPGAASAAAVAVVPSDTTLSVGDDFYIRVEADAFSDLKAYELIFQFDPTIVQLLGALPGNVIADDGDPYFGTLVNEVSAPQDSAWYNAAMLTGATQGPGVLVYFHFKALVMGVSPLDCRKVDYRDSNNVQTLPGCSSGIIRVVGVTETRQHSWGRLKNLYR